MTTSGKRRLGSFLAALFLAASACAHSMYQSDVMLDFAGNEIHVELQVPLERMETAFGKHIGWQTLDRDRPALKTYITSRFHARTLGGQAFETQIRSPLAIATVDGAPYLVARLLLRPPLSYSAEQFEIEDDVVLDRLPSQVALVSIHSDWSAGIFANDPQLVGVLRSNSRSVLINRAGQSWFQGFTSIFRLGIRHIAEGTDHLLFLLALLLPAPLLVANRYWTGPAGVRQSLLRILKVVTAFTIGHSITLALAALDLVRVPSQPIEVLIAVSILISAAHALRPLFPGREAAIAAFFGLIHGLAFATTLGELGLRQWERVASIFAFNLGIEAMQLVVVAATLPSLILLSRTKAYSLLRISGGLFAGFASLGWITERLFDQHTSVDVLVDGMAHHAIWMAGILFTLSLVCWSLRDTLNKPSIVLK